MSDATRLLMLTALAATLAGCGSAGGLQAPGADALAGASPEIVASVGEQRFTLADVDAKAKATSIEPYQALYEARRQALETMIVEHLLNTAARSRGITRDALIEQEVNQKIAAPSVQEVQSFYDQNQQAMQGRSLEQMTPQIQNYLTGQRRQRTMQVLLAELKKTQPVNVALEPPRVPVTIAENDPTKGPAGAPVQIVTFSDFQCPYCSRVVPSLDQIVAKYGDQVQLVFRDFPLAFHDRAQPAAEAAQCAHAQGKFWEYHDALFANQQALADADLQKRAAALGLDVAEFSACLAAGRFRNDVLKDLEEGSRFGVSGTPAFFVNGRFLSGGQPFEAFAKFIDEELAMKGIRVN